VFEQTLLGIDCYIFHIIGNGRWTFPFSFYKESCGREISRDYPGLDADDDVPEEEMGTFKRATDQVLATRRIVKVCRNQPSSAVSSNPVAAVRIERHSEGNLGDSAKEPNGTNEAVDKSKTETDEPAKGVGEELKDDSAQDVTEPGSGFSNPSFSFGTLPKTDCSFSFSTSGFGSGSGSIFSLKGSSTPLLLFGTGSSNNGSSSLLGLGSSSTEVNKSNGNALLMMQEVPVETGEENEKAVFVADASLFEFLNGGWKERGNGELKLNIATDGIGKPRLIMRTKGNYRLILNASLYPDMKLTNMEKKDITFSCINSAVEGRNTLSTFALRFNESATEDAFRTAVMDHTGKKIAGLEAPESSPKAPDD
ncbi:Nuclear pore complex protein, partial [Nymphaea thermarum]